MTTAAWKAGLEDVVAARSAICRVDGEAGRLYYRGYEIGDLAERASFEAVTHLLWFGDLPEPAAAAAFADRLRAAVRLRGGAGGRLVRPRPRAVRRQPPDPAPGRVRGAGAPRRGCR